MGQISKEGFQKLTEELNHLKNVKRKEIAKAIGEAREHGDLRENSAYHEARKEQSFNEAKITELEAKLSDVQIIDDSDKPKDCVSLGSKVKFKSVDADEVREYTVVSDLEANIFEKKISCETPMGEAFMGAKKGEIVEVLAPAGLMKFQIV